MRPHFVAAVRWRSLSRRQARRGLTPQPSKGHAQAWPGEVSPIFLHLFRVGRAIPLPAGQPLTVFPAHRRSGSQQLHVRPLETKEKSSDGQQERKSSETATRGSS